jgi:hypothetical protein
MIVLLILTYQVELKVRWTQIGLYDLDQIRLYCCHSEQSDKKKEQIDFSDTWLEIQTNFLRR